MHNDDVIVSAFGEKSLNDGAAAFDFSRASLVGSGKHCDVYRLRWHNRLVCIKKIKPEEIANPIIRQALRKEFELGFALSHPAIPRYILHNDDFIVMDFVDGNTILSLLHRKDPWLSSPENQIQLMGELLDALEYLHSRNIVHCDVKADNVMITSGTHRAMLLDLGLAHTDWLDNTAGDPSRFGLDADHPTGNPNVDYNALAVLAQRIGEAGYNISGLKRFINCCRKPDVSPAQLRQALSPEKSRTFLLSSAAIAAAIIAVVAIFTFYSHKTEKPAEIPAKVVYADSASSIADDAPPVAAPQQSTNTIDNNTNQTNADIIPAAKIDYKTYIAENVSTFFPQTNKLIKECEQKIANGSAEKMTDEEIANAINLALNTYKSEYAAACKTLKTKFPDDNRTNIEIALGSTALHADLLSRLQNVMQSMTNIIAVRDGNM